MDRPTRDVDGDDCPSPRRYRGKDAFRRRVEGGSLDIDEAHPDAVSRAVTIAQKNARVARMAPRTRWALATLAQA